MGLKVSMAGKMGDLVYALPVIKALARQHGPITLVTSGICYQLVPLLWEQPYLADVVMDYSRTYRIDDHGCMEPWCVLSPEEGINLSPQPSLYRPGSPVPWTMAYAEIAGIKDLSVKDRIALPTLWNHRQWYWEHTVEDGVKPWKPPPTCVLAPETESLKPIPLWLWKNLAEELRHHFRVVMIGRKPDNWTHSNGIVDLRGLTTVSTIARMLAEAHVALCANSLPWHLARHAGTPTACFQDQHIDRCVPVDTPSIFFTSERAEEMVEWAISFSPSRQPRTTLCSPEFLAQIQQPTEGREHHGRS